MFKDVVCINDDWAGLDGRVLAEMPKKGVKYTPMFYGPMPLFPDYKSYSFECFNNITQIYFDANHFVDADSIDGQIALSLAATAPVKRFTITSDEDYKKAIEWGKTYLV